jgi:hypothetical protein
MAQTGFTPIQLYSTSTAAAVPVAGNLINSTLGSELAINITDGKLFYKDNLGAVQVIAWKVVPTTAGGTGLTSYTAGDLVYYASGTTLTKLAIGTTGQWLGSSGTAPQWNSPAALTKTDDTNVTLTLGGNPSTALLNAASLTLGWTGTLATTRGGTGLASFTANGILYASSTSALATGSALTFDGTNFATTGAATAARFIPTGSTVPANGLYLPTANTLGFAASSALQATLSTGGLALTASFTVGSGGTYAAGSIYSDANWGFLVRAKQASPVQAIYRFANSADVECFRVDNSNNLSLASGNLVIATSGKGIDFSATPGTGTSELLADYEEGTWTATLTNIAGGTVTNTNYVKVGNMVTARLSISGGTYVANSSFFSLPFACVALTSGTFSNATIRGGFLEAQASSNCYFSTSDSGNVHCTITYITS